MFAFTEVLQIIIALTVACLVGFILAVRGLRLNRRKTAIGIIALVLNGLPLLFLVFLWLKGATRGL